MPAYPLTFKFDGIEDQEVYLFGYAEYWHLTNNLYTVVTQAVVASIAWKVRTKTDGGTVAEGSFVVADTIFDTLISTADVGPSNFRARLAGTCFPAAGTEYVVDVVLTLTGSPANTVPLHGMLRTRP